MTNTVQRAANEATFERIATLHAEMSQAAKEASQLVIKGVNTGRELGLCFQELCNHEQMTLEFFQKVSARLPKNIDFGFVQRCEWIARHVKDPVKDLDEARQAEAQLYYAFDLMPEPKRLTQQTAHGEESPVAWMLSTFSSVSSKYNKYKDCDSWPTPVVSSAIDQLSRIIVESQSFRMKLTKILEKQQQ